MKALTLYHPHAMLVETGWKEVETRGWYTDYRGPLAIHAAKRWTDEERDTAVEIVHRLRRMREDKFPQEDWRLGISDCLWHHGKKGEQSLGCIVAVCELAACLSTSAYDRQVLETNSLFCTPSFTPAHGWDVERIMGNYEEGRFAWILRDVRPVFPYIPVRGNRKLWEWTPPEGAFSLAWAKEAT
jgi:hypothetical protein